jgi:hypothetical protein
MKVICISTAKGPSNRSLTLGKWYNVLDVTFYYDNLSKIYSYQIMDDSGFATQYISTLFKTVDEVREDKLNQILQ